MIDTLYLIVDVLLVVMFAAAFVLAVCRTHKVYFMPVSRVWADVTIRLEHNDVLVSGKSFPLDSYWGKLAIEGKGIHGFLMEDNDVISEAEISGLGEIVQMIEPGSEVEGRVIRSAAALRQHIGDQRRPRKIGSCALTVILSAGFIVFAIGVFLWASRDLAQMV